ncbi:MAG: hypothetical protein NVSMB48_10690 [Marmoricola sp.]
MGSGFKAPRATRACPTEAIEEPTIYWRLSGDGRIWPEMNQGLISVSAGQALIFVAGTGFEPVTSGRDRATCDSYGVRTVATGFPCFERETGLLPVTGYPSDTDPEQLNLDPKWTLVDSGHAVNRHSPPQPRAR